LLFSLVSLAQQLWLVGEFTVLTKQTLLLAMAIS